jgi:hypothetical protein
MGMMKRQGGICTICGTKGRSFFRHTGLGQARQSIPAGMIQEEIFVQKTLIDLERMV